MHSDKHHNPALCTGAKCFKYHCGMRVIDACVSVQA